jgi:hypothetical protein
MGKASSGHKREGASKCSKKLLRTCETGFLINIIPCYSLKNKERDGEAPSWLQLTKSKTFKTNTSIKCAIIIWHQGSLHFPNSIKYAYFFMDMAVPNCSMCHILGADRGQMLKFLPFLTLILEFANEDPG